MEKHSTNQVFLFIEVADDCPAKRGEVPPLRKKKSIARLQYEILQENPYRLTSDDVLFQVYALRKELPEVELETAKEKFFSKGQPCFRSSPLTNRYGWGIHSNHEGKLALFGRESMEYEYFVRSSELKVVKALRSKKKA